MAEDDEEPRPSSFREVMDNPIAGCSIGALIMTTILGGWLLSSWIERFLVFIGFVIIFYAIVHIARWSDRQRPPL